MFSRNEVISSPNGMSVGVDAAPRMGLLVKVEVLQKAAHELRENLGMSCEMLGAPGIPLAGTNEKAAPGLAGQLEGLASQLFELNAMARNLREHIAPQS